MIGLVAWGRRIRCRHHMTSTRSYVVQGVPTLSSQWKSRYSESVAGTANVNDYPPNQPLPCCRVYGFDTCKDRLDAEEIALRSRAANLLAKLVDSQMPIVDGFRDLALYHAQPNDRPAGSGDDPDPSFILLHVASLKIPVVAAFLECMCDDELRAGAHVWPRLGLPVTAHIFNQWQLAAKMTAPRGYKILRLPYRWLRLNKMELMGCGVDITEEIIEVKAEAPPDPVTKVLQAPWI